MLEIIVIAGLIGLTTSIAHGLWGPRARARRRLRHGPTEIADRQLVTLSGTVRSCGEVLVAPLSGHDCVAYEATADLFRPKRGLYDQPDRFRFGETTTFELVTDAQTIVVEASPADVALPTTPVIPRSLEREQAFLEAHDKSITYVFKSKFEEAIVVDGDRIVVQGMAIVEQANDAGERGYREAPTRVRLVAHPQHPLTIGKPR